MLFTLDNMIKDLCTIFDSNYLLKGLTLYKSLEDLKIDYTLHCLCLDDKSYDTITRLSLSNLKVYSIKDIEKEDIKNIKSKIIKSKYGDEYSQYCWMMTPYFCNYILESDFIKDSILYIDSDIYFYQNFTKIENEVNEHSVGIITHRTLFHLNTETDVGKYNVGIVYFKKDTNGINCSRFWKDLLLNQSNQYAKKYGTCGDQKYLELFESRFDVCIMDSFGHGAPWCFPSYDYLSKYNIIWVGKNQEMVFNHFSHFNLIEDGWKSSNNGEWNPETFNKYIMEYYQDYYQEMIKVKNLYKL